MHKGKVLIGLLIALALAGCGAVTKEGMYEGLKARERMVDPQAEQPTGERSPSYGEYEAERKKLESGGTAEGR
jgi:hypothetical protein